MKEEYEDSPKLFNKTMPQITEEVKITGEYDRKDLNLQPELMRF